MSAFHLAASLAGHGSDVRALCSPSSRTIISSSRDATARIWSSDKTGHWTDDRVIKDPDGKYVSSVACVTIGDDVFIALGSASGTITLWPSSASDSGSPAYTLVGHEKNVCALDGNQDGLLVSGSWDKTATVWKDFKPFVTMKSHKEAVWAVAIVGDSQLLTGSADKTIQLHDLHGKLLQTFNGHTDCVRSICMGRQQGTTHEFWSAGNDANVIQWSTDNPQPLRILQGHSSFIYSISPFPDHSGVVTSSEDGSVRVWEGGACTQTIMHPTVSVWAVQALSNGDVVSGSSDGIIRVFSRSEDRKASVEELEIFEKAVKHRQINKAQVGDVKHTDLPGLEALGKPGNKEGQVIMVKNNGKVEAYQWESAGTTWQQIGEVVDAVGSGRKQLYQGVEYDYVFDVDITEGAPPLKLPYNVTENPHGAAQKFLERNELPLSYVDQVVKFLEANTQGAQLGTGGSGLQDPFTGSGAYRGGDSSASTTPAYRDPFTGAGGYRPGGSTKTSSGTGSTDPFTGSGAYSSSSDATRSAFTPIKVPQHFNQINVNAVKGKITEFKVALKESGTGLTESEEATLEEIFSDLSSPAPASSQSSEKWDVRIFLDLLSRWPADKRFPLIDLTRVLCTRSSRLVGYESTSEDTILDRLLSACDWASEWEATKAREINTMLVARALANLTATAAGKRRLSSGRVPELLSYLSSRHPYTTFNKNTRVAFASFALNLSIMAVNNELPTSHGKSLLQFISNILANESEDSETAYRTIVALGNMVSSPNIAGSLPVGDVQLAKELASGLASKLGDARLVKVAQEI